MPEPLFLKMYQDYELYAPKTQNKLILEELYSSHCTREFRLNILH